MLIRAIRAMKKLLGETEKKKVKVEIVRKPGASLPERYIVRHGDKKYEFSILYGIAAICPKCNKPTNITVTEYLKGECVYVREFIYCHNCKRVSSSTNKKVYDKIPKEIRENMLDLSTIATYYFAKKWFEMYDEKSGD